MQNLRARAYDPANGRFIGLDPFAGNMQDPQSLHKYAYVHGDPVQGSDPTGLWGSFGVSLATAMVYGMIASLNVTLPYAGALAVTGLIQKYSRESNSGLAGDDITPRLIRLKPMLENAWAAKTLEQRQAILDYSTGLHLSALHGFDIDVLNSKELQKYVTHDDLPGYASRSVTVMDNAYYAHEVNYVLWGVFLAVAKKSGDSNLDLDGGLRLMKLWRYSFGMVLYGWQPHDGDVEGREAWARAGYNWIMSGTLKAPTNTRLQNVTPSKAKASVAMEVTVGRPFNDNPLATDRVRFHL